MSGWVKLFFGWSFFKETVYKRVVYGNAGLLKKKDIVGFVKKCHMVYYYQKNVQLARYWYNLFFFFNC